MIFLVQAFDRINSCWGIVSGWEINCQAEIYYYPELIFFVNCDLKKYIDTIRGKLNTTCIKPILLLGPRTLAPLGESSTEPVNNYLSSIITKNTGTIRRKLNRTY